MCKNPKSRCLAVLLAAVLGAACWDARADDHHSPPPPPPPTPYPAIPLPPYPYPTLTAPRPMPTSVFQLPKPKPQKSPTHPAYPVKRGDEGKKAEAPPMEGKPLPVASALLDPNWSKVAKQYEDRFIGYQRQLDDLLAKYKGDWDAMMKDPLGRDRCEAVLKRWGEDEKRLVNLYKRATGEAPADAKPAGGPDGSGTKSKNDEELNVSDIDG